MHTESIDVVHGPICFLACQRRLLMCKKSIANVPVASIYIELSFVQIVFSHYTPSFLHIPKMMMNVAASLQPTSEYSTLFSLFFSTFFRLSFFSTIPLPPLAFVCAHSFVFPFPLLFIVVFQLHYLRSY
jgi:hypothetical protein